MIDQIRFPIIGEASSELAQNPRPLLEKIVLLSYAPSGLYLVVKIPGLVKMRILVILKRVLRRPVWAAYVKVFEHTSLIQRLVAWPYLKRPLARWPRRIGKVLDINLPIDVYPLPKPSPACAANINNMIALMEITRTVEGDIAECGVFREASLIPLAFHAAQQGINKTFHGFDSFEGFAPSIANDLQFGGVPLSFKKPGGMNETSRVLVAGKAKA